MSNKPQTEALLEVIGALNAENKGLQQIIQAQNAMRKALLNLLELKHAPTPKDIRDSIKEMK